MIRQITGNLVDVFARRTYYARVTFGHTIQSIEELDSQERVGESYIMPGFVDSHVHIESSMLSPQRFAEMVAPCGTVGVVCDPHEIANVLGEKGVRYMMADASKSPMKFAFAIPSCVPATPFETNGAEFGVREIRRLMPQGVALAEMMNYPGVWMRDEQVMAKIGVAREQNRPVDGHIPGIVGEKLEQYVSAGISTDHESYTLEEAKAKIALGMKILIREGSAARNLEALAPLFLTDVQNIMACTDDAHPDDIRARGHVDKFFRYAMRMGVPVYDILQVLAVNPVMHYKLKVGLLRKGDRADFLIAKNINDLQIESVYIEGEMTAQNGAPCFTAGHAKRINNFIDREFTDDDFRKIAKTENPTEHVVGLIPDQLVTEHLLWNPVAKAGEEIVSDAASDTLKISVVCRYQQRPVVNAFIRGAGLKGGAMASSVAHDSHNVVVIGTDAHSMRLTAEAVFEAKGGIAVVSASGSVSRLRLPIAGLMSGDKWERVADKYEKLVALAHEELQTTLPSPFMTMAFMSLVVIPSLKVSDQGLFDVDKFEFVKE